MVNYIEMSRVKDWELYDLFSLGFLWILKCFETGN